MAFTKYLTDIPPRDPSLGYETLGAGLYPDEAVYELDTGELVAVSVRADRAPWHNGMTFIGWARLIDETGETITDSMDQECELEHRVPADAPFIAEHGRALIATSLLMILLGEDHPTGCISLNPRECSALSIRTVIESICDAGEMSVGPLLGE